MLNNVKQKFMPENWQKAKLGEIAFFRNGKGHEQDISGDGDFVVVNSKYISSNGRVVKKTNKNLCPLEVNDVAIVMSDVPKGKAIAKCFLVNENNKYTLNQRIGAIKSNKLNALFLRSLLNRNKYFLSFDDGVNQTNLRKDDILNCPLIFPPLPEQNKIVKILETWDENLEKITKKIEIKKSIKKGLMQKLLRGEFRLKGFNEKWKNVKLGDIINFKNGKAHENNIVENGKYIVINSKFISSNARVYKCSDKNLSPLSKGEISMVMSDVPNGKAIAKCFLVDEDDKYTLNQRICSLFPKNADSKFLYYILNRNKYFLQFDDGVNQTNLRKDDILDCHIEIPCIKEQRAIANILTTADLEIKSFENKKKIIEDQKRYLLSNLITGKIRIPEFEKVK